MAAASTAALRARPFFGRPEVRRRILQRIEATKGGAGGFVLLAGEGGVGKSTLLRAVVEDAQERDFLVLEARALPSDLPRPFAVIQELLRSDRGPGASFAEGASGAPVSLPLLLAPLEQGLADSTHRPAGTPDARTGDEPEDRLLALLAGPPERIEESRLLLHDRVTAFLADVARRQPLLIAIDDIEFADDPSLEFLRSFAAVAAERPILVVGTTVPVEEAPPRSAAALRRLTETPGLEPLTIRRLSEGELPEYLRWLLGGREPSRDSVVRWFTQTEGNPLFLEQIVRGTMALGPTATPEGPEAGPRDLEEVLRDRVQALSDADRRVLVYGAVLGKEFDFPTLHAAAAINEEELAESVDRLVRRGLLREKGGEVYEFVREAVRAEAYGALTETRRRILHRKVALAIEARSHESGPSVFELARQFYLAREDGKALEYNRRAAELASAAYAYDAAIVHLERALECARRVPGGDPTVDLRLRIELGRILDDFGDLPRAEEVLREAVDRARRDPSLEPDLGLALLWLARNLQNQGLNADARTLAEEAHAIFQRQGNRRGILVSHRVLGTAGFRLGDFEVAERHLRREVELAETEGDPWERGHSLIDLANALVTQGEEKATEALELYNRAGQLFAATKDFASQSRVHMNRSLVHHSWGRTEEAIRDLTLAGEAAEKSGSRIWMGYCALNEAQFRAELDQLDRAKAALERARHLLAPLGDQLADQQLTMIEGMIAEAGRQYDLAGYRYEEALAKARSLKLRAETVEVEYRLARLRWSEGKAEAARAHLKAALDDDVLGLHADLGPAIRKLQQDLAL
jgi:tetratricopeptide (TPR) repeat protein